MTSGAHPATGWWLAGGGAALLAAVYAASLFDSASVIDATALRIGASSGSLLLGLGVFFLVGFHGGRQESTTGSAVRLSPYPVGAPECGSDASWRSVQGLFQAFSENLPSACGGRDLWGAFDQFAREMLAKHADVRRVRCFALREHDDRLCSLSANVEDGRVISARGGLLGHVATTGRRYWAGDESLGELVHRLASEDRERWAIVWPVRADGSTIGLIAAAEARGDASRAAAVFQCMEFLWRHLALHDRLHSARATDNATGVLTRAEFFRRAAEAVEESNRQREPIVITALALEGLRGLDDKGLWRARDTLVPGIGRRLLEKLRSDDIVGRLSDDRFVILMRRLDSPLARLIAKQFAENLKREIARHEEFVARINVRLGLAGSGLRPADLDGLLTSAWRSVDLARTSGVDLHVDAPEGDSTGDRRED